MSEERIYTSQWYTPERLAYWMAGLVEVRNKRVLEPSAGTGVIVRALVHLGCPEVVACEIDEGAREELDASGATEVVYGNFLEQNMVTLGDSRPFNLAIMNPPFEGGQAIEHMEHALSMCDEVISLVPLSTLSCMSRLPFWRRNRLIQLTLLPRRPRFTGPHDKQKHGQAELCVMRVTRGRDSDNCRVEWVEL